MKVDTHGRIETRETARPDTGQNDDRRFTGAEQVACRLRRSLPRSLRLVGESQRFDTGDAGDIFDV